MPGRFDKGVNSFTYAECTVQVAFPEDNVACRWCPFLKHYDNIDRDRCQLTDEILFSREFIGQRCPLTILNTVKVEDLK